MITIDPSARENGLAMMLSQLIEENIKHPDKRDDFMALGLRLGIVASDANVSLTMVFAHGSLVFYDGLQPNLDLVVTTTSEKITALSLLPIRRAGMVRVPDLLAEESWQLATDLFSRNLQIRGLVWHPLALLRLTRLLSVNEK